MRPALAARWGCALWSCLALGGCALFAKSEPLSPRYYTPEYVQAGPAQDPPASAPAGTGLRLRLGRVQAASSLGERLAYRTPDNQLAFRNDQRWTEPPETYLARTLARALFEERGLTMVVSGSAPTLDVSLTAFEEILGADHKVRAEAVIVLHDDTVSHLYETLRSEQRVPDVSDDERAVAVVRAFSESLRKLVAQVAERSVAALRVMESSR